MRSRKRSDFYSEIYGDNIEEIVHRLLNSSFWMKGLDANTRYTRIQDDHDGTFKGRIAVTFAEDGDAYVMLQEPDFGWSLRFRMPMLGGGASPRTRTALVILAEAIRLDNLERPMQPPPKTEAAEAAEAVCRGCEYDWPITIVGEDKRRFHESSNGNLFKCKYRPNETQLLET